MMLAHNLICCVRPEEGVESPLERYIKASKELDDCPTDMEHYMVRSSSRCAPSYDALTTRVHVALLGAFPFCSSRDQHWTTTHHKGKMCAYVRCAMSSSVIWASSMQLLTNSKCACAWPMPGTRS